MNSHVALHNKSCYRISLMLESMKCRYPSMNSSTAADILVQIQSDIRQKVSRSLICRAKLLNELRYPLLSLSDVQVHILSDISSNVSSNISSFVWAPLYMSKGYSSSSEQYYNLSDRLGIIGAVGRLVSACLLYLFL